MKLNNLQLSLKYNQQPDDGALSAINTQHQTFRNCLHLDRYEIREKTQNQHAAQIPV